MICIRCGEAEITTDAVFMVSHNHDPDMGGAIDAALRRQGINGTAGLGELCERCWEVANAAIESGTRLYAAAHRDVFRQQYESNVGRPLTSAEREAMDQYFDGAGDEGNSSGT